MHTESSPQCFRRVPGVLAPSVCPCSAPLTSASLRFADPCSDTMLLPRSKHMDATASQTTGLVCPQAVADTAQDTKESLTAGRRWTAAVHRPWFQIQGGAKEAGTPEPSPGAVGVLGEEDAEEAAEGGDELQEARVLRAALGRRLLRGPPRLPQLRHIRPAGPRQQ